MWPAPALAPAANPAALSVPPIATLYFFSIQSLGLSPGQKFLSRLGTLSVSSPLGLIPYPLRDVKLCRVPGGRRKVRAISRGVAVEDGLSASCRNGPDAPEG